MLVIGEVAEVAVARSRRSASVDDAKVKFRGAVDQTGGTAGGDKSRCGNVGVHPFTARSRNIAEIHGVDVSGISVEREVTFGA